MVSIRTPRAGRDSIIRDRDKPRKCFYPHAPGGARPFRRTSSHAPSMVFLSARPGRGATLHHVLGVGNASAVSIRTPRAGRDSNGLPADSHACRFLSARPGRGATLKTVCVVLLAALFLSARPGRGATKGTEWLGKRTDVSIRTPRAGRDLVPGAHWFEYQVSIRTPRAGRDDHRTGTVAPLRGFYPHAPGGARRHSL